MCCTLPLVPLNEVLNAWEIIKTTWETEDVGMNNILNFIENTWIFRNHGPIYSPTIWNHHMDLTRTNNAAEGFHSKLNRCINKPVVSFYEVVFSIKSIQMDCNAEILRLLAGGRTKTKKKKYVAQNIRISLLWDHYRVGRICLFDLMFGLRNAIKIQI